MDAYRKASARKNRFKDHQSVFSTRFKMTPFWLALWSCALAVSWLLPNHYLPWPSFHSDAWCAAVLWIGSAAVALRIKSAVVWHWSSVVILALLSVPSLQYATGLIPFGGQAVIVSAYTIGLLLAVLTGARWEQGCPDQALNGLFTAIGIAGVFSVFLQFQTWLNLIETGIFDIWSMGLSGARPYANLGQPNQLATLLIWGVLASGWAFNKRVIGGAVAVLLAAFLLAGVALTQSRTAWLGLAFVTACSWAWRSLWRSKCLPLVLSGLFLYFIACYFLLHSVGFLLGVTDGDGYFRGSGTGDLRFSAWKMFVAAALERPWFGYGWAEVGHAQLAVADNYAPLFAVFGHSHNLILDVVLWLGIPLSILISAGLATWCFMQLRAVNDFKGAIAVMFLGVVGIHAMMELPLHYAYFLLPVGVVFGVLNHRSSLALGWTSPRWTLGVVCTVSALLLTGIVLDYFKVESSYRDARFEAARIGNLPVGAPPDVIFLTQLQANINFMRYNVNENMSKKDLDWMISVVRSYPSAGRMFKLARALVMNSRQLEGVAWLSKVCKVASPEDCLMLKRLWEREATENKLFESIDWPLTD